MAEANLDARSFVFTTTTKEKVLPGDILIVREVTQGANWLWVKVVPEKAVQEEAAKIFGGKDE